MRKIIGSFIICIIGILLNLLVYKIFISMISLPLYLDTIFTIAVTFICGPLWGVLTGALTNVYTIIDHGWDYYLFALCNIATALITWFFIRLFPRELNLRNNAAASDVRAAFAGRSPIAVNSLYQADSRRLSAVMDRVIVLTLLSFALCIAVSILGGCISVFIGFIKASADNVNPAAVPTMFHGNIPMLPNEILSRIPINIIDRLISVFAAYGVAIVSYNVRFARVNVK